MLIPLGGVVYYLFSISHDQYASTVGFSVRSEDTAGSTQSLLGSLSSLSGASSSDTDILYEFIQSQTIVERVNSRIDLAALYSLPTYDPVFAYDASGTIEDLLDYWQRMVKVSYASGTGLLELRVLAFRPEDAEDIAKIIVDEASVMINELSNIAHSDATRHAAANLNYALERLKSARQNLTLFRSQTRIIDPLADLQGQQGLLNSLEAQLAEAYINLILLQETSNEDGPRIKQINRRIKAIKELIDQERQKFGTSGVRNNDENYSTLISEFENLSVEVEYAQQAYLAAQTMLDTAQAEAQRQSRYLAVYAKPSRAQSSRYPERVLLSFVIAAFLMIAWSVGVLVYYSLRDRR